MDKFRGQYEAAMLVHLCGTPTWLILSSGRIGYTNMAAEKLWGGGGEDGFVLLALPAFYLLTSDIFPLFTPNEGGPWPPGPLP